MKRIFIFALICIVLVIMWVCVLICLNKPTATTNPYKIKSITDTTGKEKLNDDIIWWVIITSG